MSVVMEELAAATAAVHLDEEEEHEDARDHGEDHTAGVSLNDLESVKEAIRKQIEFYFSDANLPTDKHLVKQIKKDPEGYVPIKVLANFKRVKALTKDLEVVTAALQASNQLQVQPDTKRVRRVAPLPEVDMEDIERRTVLVEHLPATPTIDSVTQLFARHGEVRMVRISAQGSKQKLPTWLSNAVSKMMVGSQQYALVEFATEEEAVKAVAAYKDLDNWRTSLRVRHLRQPKQTSRPGSRTDHLSSTGHRLSDSRGHGSSSGGAQHGKAGGQRRSSHDGSHKAEDMPSLPPVRTSVDGRHGQGGGGSRPLSPYGGSNRGTPPLSPSMGGSGAGAGPAAAAAVAAALRPATPNSAATPGVSPRPAGTPPGNQSEVSAFIDRILSTPTSGANTPNPSTPLGGAGGPGSPRGRLTPAFGGFPASSSQSGSPRRQAGTPTRVPAAATAAGEPSVGVAPATAAAAAAAAAAALAGSPRTSNSSSWRPFGSGSGASASAPVTPLSGATGLLSPEGHGAGDASKPGPWVPAHRLALHSGAGSDAEGSRPGSARRPPCHRRSSGADSDGELRATGRSDGGESSDGSIGGSRCRRWPHGTGHSLRTTIEAIREASCELDPAVAATAIATLSGTASAAAATAGALEGVGAAGGGRRRSRRRSSSTAAAAAGEEGMAGGGEIGEACGQQQQQQLQRQRSGRQRRRSTGSRRQSLDLQGGHSGASSPEQDKHHTTGHHSSKHGGGGSSGGEEAKSKHKQKKDYAAWAAATVEFRQEATRAAAAGSSSGGRAGVSPSRAAVHHAGEAQKEAHARVARMPDGTRGFSLGRGRPLATPPPA